ncbi:suppressor of fused domain protein [Spirillospora sp. NPDC029432]|uniref:suppressor of fused domain protein n=1 Tax=Spirillospora sp. NPDC029432 TaxID=3154599 RepID=UPI003454E17F
MVSPYEGLLDHAERYLGAVTHGEPPDVLGYNRGFAIGFHRHPEHDMVSAASTGLRFQDLEFEIPEEIVCSARPGQEQEASYLVHVGAQLALKNGRGLGHGAGYRNAEPLIPETRISSLAFSAHPRLPEEFDHYRDADGEPVLRFVTLIPMTEPEFRFVTDEKEGLHGLMEVWRLNRTDILDLYRESAV